MKQSYDLHLKKHRKKNTLKGRLHLGSLMEAFCPLCVCCKNKLSLLSVELVVATLDKDARNTFGNNQTSPLKRLLRWANRVLQFRAQYSPSLRWTVNSPASWYIAVIPSLASQHSKNIKRMWEKEHFWKIHTQFSTVFIQSILNSHYCPFNCF